MPGAGTEALMWLTYKEHEGKNMKLDGRELEDQAWNGLLRRS